MVQQAERVEGRFKSRYLGYELVNSSNNNPQMVCEFELLEGPGRGQRVFWYGTFTENAFAITYRGMKALGWQGTSVSTFRNDAKLNQEVTLVIEQESYNGKPRTRVVFINRLGINRENALSGDDRMALGAMIEELVAKGAHLDRRNVVPLDGEEFPVDGDDDIPF